MFFEFIKKEINSLNMNSIFQSIEYNLRPFSLYFFLSLLFAFLGSYISFYTVSIVLILITYYCEIGIRTNMRFLLKILQSYLIFLILNKLFFITSQINNDTLEWPNFIKLGILKIAFLLLVLSFFVYIQKKTNKQKVFHSRKLRSRKYEKYLNPFFSSLVFIKVLSSNIILNYFSFSNFIILFINTLGIYFICYILSNLYLNGFFSFVRTIKSHPINCMVFLSVTLAFLFNFLIQFSLRTPGSIANQYIFKGALLFQILILTVFNLLIYSVTNSLLRGTFFTILIGGAFSYINYLKVNMRNEPLLFSDLAWIKNINLVVTFVDIQFVIYFFIAIVFFIFLYFKTKKYFGILTIFSYKLSRICYSSILLIFVLFNYFVFSTNNNGKIMSNIPIVSNLNNEIDINWLGFKTNASYKSLAFVWYKQLTMKIMDEPNNYSKQKIEEIYNKYSEISRNINQSRANNISNQTVIFILSESFFNPLRIPGTEISNDILNNISEISLNSTSGTMKSDGYGGGTANMEFQALTGLPYYNFSSSVTTIYTEVVPEMTSIPSISDNFSKENRFVLHPSDANNYDRKDIYEKLDFSSLIFQFNSEKSFENIKTQGISISDETVYNNVLLELDSEKSQFFSIITMQNHAPWSEEYPKELTAINSNLSDEENEKLTNYVRLLSYTDVATANFIRSLEEVEKDITVVFYGDHLPGFYPQHIFNESPEIQYQTDYFIWSNFETNSKSNNNFINSSDFIASLFETTNSKVSPYYALLTEVMNHATINKINLTKAEQIIADDLKLIQYDITIGDGYIFEFEDFFNIKSED